MSKVFELQALLFCFDEQEALLKKAKLPKAYKCQSMLFIRINIS